MLTIPVASCNDVVCARAGSTQARSASGDPPTQTAPYPSASIWAARSGVIERVGSHAPNRPRSGLSATASVTVPPRCLSAQSERPRQFGQRRDKVFMLGEDLHGDVVGARVEVLFQPRGDLLGGAVGH